VDINLDQLLRRSAFSFHPSNYLASVGAEEKLGLEQCFDKKSAKRTARLEGRTRISECIVPGSRPQVQESAKRKPTTPKDRRRSESGKETVGAIAASSETRYLSNKRIRTKSIETESNEKISDMNKAIAALEKERNHFRGRSIFFFFPLFTELK
jgi:hypothetical protein